MADYLKPLPEQAVAAWYYRLAASIASNKVQGSTPLAAVFLKQWLDNRKPNSIFNFTPPAYLQNHTAVMTALQYHRDVFLTLKKARIGKTDKWAGILPRIKGTDGYKKWPGGSIAMKYESLCDIAPGVFDIISIQNSGTAADRDLLTALRGFQLESSVIVDPLRMPDKTIQVKFTSWKCRVLDTYDWNYNEYFTVPNPDFGSKDKNAVRPQDKSIRVYHSNAKRLEDANLAAPYKIESAPWPVTNAALLNKAVVDPARTP
ncbi:MAG: hypothetical protein OEZ39_16605 [Gammaproteobacteria bacterium]|nr:hypothetical protein [Gammaproteobacteria bacterium]MDH5653482.1 hypothetical protein [Gammaproteobacteria bacterium]